MNAPWPRGLATPEDGPGATPGEAVPAPLHDTDPMSALLAERLARMQAQGDFPALSASIGRIQRLTASEHESLHALSAAILEDVALTQKLLRLVNTAMFSHAGAGSIGTVSRAVALVGFGGVRNLALSLLLLEHLGNRSHAQRLRQVFLRVLLAAMLASAVARGEWGGEAAGEEAFLGTLFQSLGRLLLEHHFPEDAARVRAAVGEGPGHDTEADPTAWDERTWMLFGWRLQDLGVIVARDWQLPETLTAVMRLPDGEPPRRPLPGGVERLRWLGRAALELADAILDADVERYQRRVAALAQKHHTGLGLPVRSVVEAAARARAELPSWAHTLGLDILPAAARRPAPAPARRRDDAVPSAWSPLSSGRMTPGDERRGLPANAAADPQARRTLLGDGIRDITELMLADDASAPVVLRALLETLYRALGLHRVALCLPDTREPGWLVGRLGLGPGVEHWLRTLRVPLQPLPTDLFSLVCAKGVDTLLDDTRTEDVARRLPAGYVQHIGAPTLLLLPLVRQGRCLGLLYADRARPHELVLSEDELALVRALKNQAMLALKLGPR